MPRVRILQRGLAQGGVVGRRPDHQSVHRRVHGVNNHGPGAQAAHTAGEYPERVAAVAGNVFSTGAARLASRPWSDGATPERRPTISMRWSSGSTGSAPGSCCSTPSPSGMSGPRSRRSHPRWPYTATFPMLRTGSARICPPTRIDARRGLAADHERFRTSVQQLWWFYAIVEREDHGGNRQALGQYGRLVCEALRRHRAEERGVGGFDPVGDGARRAGLPSEQR